MQPAIFLDRDGVIIENRDAYVRGWEDVEIFEQAVRALRRLAGLPFKIVIVTNQSAVGRGIITLETAEGINGRLVDVLEGEGARIDGVFLCPHAPDEGCGCRKPAPGMLLQAAAELDLDLGRSVLVGDALTDLAAAEAAGVPRRVLVRTGRGEAQRGLAAAAERDEYLIFDTLEQAVEEMFGAL